LARSSTAGQRAAIALAEQLGGSIDTPTSLNPAATLALQKVGQSTCSLGEVKDRADLVMFWRANPLVSHPRHWERYSVEPKGLFVPGGRADRLVVVIDSEVTETSQGADTFLRIKPGSDRQFIEALRQIAGGNELPRELEFGVSDRQVRKLAEQMKSCRYGALFFGAGQGTSEESRAAVESLFRLVTELNRFTRFTVHHMPAAGGLAGADNVLCWQTGFPFAVNFASGYPRFDPREFSANRLLEQGAVDACVVVGSEAVPKLSVTAQEALRRIPTIALDYPPADPAVAATVQFTTAIYGIHAAGTAYRMDGVPIPLRKVLRSNYPRDDEVLTAIAVGVQASKLLNR
jgi:formylmethanofuran dehydrogenase subunit B